MSKTAATQLIPNSTGFPNSFENQKKSIYKEKGFKVGFLFHGNAKLGILEAMHDVILTSFHNCP